MTAQPPVRYAPAPSTFPPPPAFPGQFPGQFPGFAPPPAQRISRRNRLFIGVAAGLVLLLFAAGTVYIVRNTHITITATKPKVVPTFPTAWDARVTPLVAFVEKERGLSFQHPVYVNFLTVAGYSASVRAGSQSKSSQAADLKQAGMYRALGLVSGNFDPTGSANQLVDNGTLAYYSYDTKQIDVRGTELTAGLRVTLAHELTHVLQDQHFDLARVNNMATSGASTGYQTLFEGDAVRVEDAYVASLSAADQTAYQNEQKAQQNSSSASLGSVPTALITLFGAPYDLGPELVKALIAKGGNPAVDDAMRNPPLDELQVFDPWVYLAHTQPQKVSDPALGKGEKGFDNGDFGAVSWYIMLAQRIDPHTAFAAADAWGGDAYVAYTKDNRSCFRADIAASSAAGGVSMLSAFNAWAQAMPAGTATISQKPGGLEMVSCDPGTGANLQPIATAADAMILPVARTEFTLSAIGSGAPQAFSQCAGTLVAESYTEAELLDPAGAAFNSARGKARLSQVVSPCRSQAQAH